MAAGRSYERELQQQHEQSHEHESDEHAGHESRPTDFDGDQGNSPSQPDSQSSTGPSSSGAGGDTLPELPKNACLWKDQHAKDLNLCYRQESCYWKDIMKKNVGFNFDIDYWETIAKVFKTLMSSVPLDLTHSSSNKLTKILTTQSTEAHHKDRPTLEDLHFFLKQAEEVRVARQKLQKKVVVQRMAKRTGTNSDILEMFISNVGMFLETFKIMLMKFKEGSPPTEAAFQYLFQTFARIFMISFSPGNVTPSRSMKIFGQIVMCQPDLRYEQDGPTNVLVVSVAEVKKEAPKMEKNYFRPEVRPATTHGAYKSQTATSSPPPKRKKIDQNYEVDLPDKVKGQHAAELLLELPYSILQPKRINEVEKQCVLGLIVQATKVRLTCLEINVDHFKQLQEPKFRPLKQDRDAYIYYSNAYDMLVKEDWEDLVEMMITLGSIGERLDGRPLDQLMPFCPKTEK